MATGEQIKSLVKAYVDNDNEKFKTIVLQIAAHEAKIGHENIARDLKNKIDKIKPNHAVILQLASQNPMLTYLNPKNKKSELIVSDEIKNKLQRIVTEFQSRDKLYKYGLKNRRKILLEGQPGTGKTLTASVIASELYLPLYTVQMDKLITKFMGETSSKLRQIFESISSYTGVYLFDEFDAIGADRSLDNEVGEMRRILNSFLQFLEQDESESIIIAATNNPRLLDKALFRRFDDVLHYSKPEIDEIKKLFEYKIKNYDESFIITDALIKKAVGLSHAEIVRICDDAIKSSILYERRITEVEISNYIKERKSIYDYKGA